jgi:hypothetical protein
MQRFYAQADSIGIPCSVEEMTSVNDWAENTGQKPRALLALRGRLKGPLCYLDIDTLLLRAPLLPAGTWDVALAENPVKTHKNRIAAQCMFIADTEGARTFLKHWAERVGAFRGIDHTHLTATVASNRVASLGRADFAGCLHLNGMRPDRTQAFS